MRTDLATQAAIVTDAAIADDGVCGRCRGVAVVEGVADVEDIASDVVVALGGTQREDLDEKRKREQWAAEKPPREGAVVALEPPQPPLW